MKKLLFFISILFTTCLNAQIKVLETSKVETIGKIAPMGQLIAELEKNEKSNIYTVKYRDIKFSKVIDIKSFSFVDVDNALENLYNVIIKGIEEQPSEKIMLELPDSFVWLEFRKQMGVSTVTFSSSINKTDVIGVSSPLTKKQIDKLFGKSK